MKSVGSRGPSESLSISWSLYSRHRQCKLEVSNLQQYPTGAKYYMFLFRDGARESQAYCTFLPRAFRGTYSKQSFTSRQSSSSAGPLVTRRIGECGALNYRLFLCACRRAFGGFTCRDPISSQFLLINTHSCSSVFCPLKGHLCYFIADRTEYSLP